MINVRLKVRRLGLLASLIALMIGPGVVASPIAYAKPACPPLILGPASVISPTVVAGAWQSNITTNSLTLAVTDVTYPHYDASAFGCAMNSTQGVVSAVLSWDFNNASATTLKSLAISCKVYALGGYYLTRATFGSQIPAIDPHDSYLFVSPATLLDSEIGSTTPPQVISPTAASCSVQAVFDS